MVGLFIPELKGAKYSGAINTVCFDVCTLAMIVKNEDNLVSFFESVMSRYSILIPSTVISEFAINGFYSLKEHQMMALIEFFKIESLSSHELRVANQISTYYVNVHCDKESKKKQKKKRNEIRNDLQVLVQSFSNNAAIITENINEFECLNDVYHLPGYKIGETELHGNINYRVPIFTYDQFKKSLFEDVLYRPQVKKYKRERFLKKDLSNEVLIQKYFFKEDIDLKPINNKRDDWNLIKEYANDILGKIVVRQSKDGLHSGCVVDLHQNIEVGKTVAGVIYDIKNKE